MTMKKVLTFFSKKSTGNILAISVVVAFFVLGLIRLYPFENNLDSVLDDLYRGGDDWGAYANFGLDVARNGILLSSVKDSYSDPGGFLYIYFLGLCFFLFGENTIPIYIIHHLMMGLAVALMYWTFRDKMKNLTSMMFLGALSLFTFLDFYKYYAVRLLSENLALFLIALFFFCFIRGFEKNNIRLQLCSASLMGFLILTRSTMLVCMFVLLVVVAGYYFKRGAKGITHLVLFISIMALTGSLLGVRNYLACGNWDFFPIYHRWGVSAWILCIHPIPQVVDLSGITTNPLYTFLCIDKHFISQYLEYMRQEPLLFFSYFSKRFLFCFGFTSLLIPVYRWRPHWMLMWIGYFTHLFLRIKDRQRFEMWEVAVHLYLIFYYLPLIAGTVLESYGFRMLLPATNFVLVFSFLAWDRLLGSRRERLL